MFFNKEESKGVWGAIMGAGTMGLHLVTGTFVGAAMGYGLDYWLGTEPWFFLFMLVMGIIAGFRMVIQDAMRIQRQNEAEQRGPLDSDANDKDE